MKCKCCKCCNCTCCQEKKMSGNKTDNGVLEIGTDEIRASYSEDTPGQKVEQFIKEREKSVQKSFQTSTCFLKIVH